MRHHDFKFSSLAYLMQFILLITLTGCEPFPIDVNVDSGNSIYDRLSFSEQENYRSLIKKTLNKDRISLIKLINFDCGGGAGCYWHGEVLAKIVYRMGENNFIELASNMTKKEKNYLRLLIRAGLEYGDFKDKKESLKIEQEFPRLNKTLQES
jgi:hypothetical protein